MTTQEWYIAIATAIQRRQGALIMVGKWQEKVTALEAEIEQLKTQQVPEAAPEQAPA